MYYYAELENAQSYSAADSLKANSLVSAKREASRKQFFTQTVIEIGDEINSQGFILEPLAKKIDGIWS